METFDNYKSSGIEWIGEIPVHWSVKKLKYVGESLIGITYSPDDVLADDSGTLVLRSSNIQKGKLAFEDCVYVSKEIPDKYRTQAGDILICARNGSAHLVGKSAFIDEKSSGDTFGAFMSVVRSNAGRFLYYFFNSQIFKSQTGLFSTSTINQLTSETLNNLFIAYPPKENEQLAIAQYLDEKTEQIDRLITNKLRLIDLLKEERMATIRQAVSGGLTPHQEPFRSSGIEELGEIPAHWEITKLKYVIQVRSGDGIKSDDIKAEAAFPVYGGNGIMGFTDAFNSDNLDIIIGRVGAKCGNVRLVGGHKWISDNALVATVKEGYSREYVSTLLESLNLNSLANQSAQPLITGTLVKDKYAAFPPAKSEQEAILKLIKAQSQRIDSTVSNIEDEIRLLKEFRTALISEVVTGKLRVA